MPLDKVTDEPCPGSTGLKVGKLFVGVSDKASLPTPATTEKLFGVKLLPFPLLSVPKVLVEKFK